MKKCVFVVIPAFNEQAMIGKVLRAVPSRVGVYFVKVIVIDDGSEDKTYQEAKRAGAVVLRHPINCGLGTALATGFTYAKSHGAQVVVTLDADGQHNPKDISKFVKVLDSSGGDVVIGSRIKSRKKMPIDRKVLNILGNLSTAFLFGVWTTDSQSGFRAFSNKALNLIEIKSNRMEVSSEFFREIKRNNLRYSEIPIDPIYTQYSRNKGQQNKNAFDVFLKMVFTLSR